MAGKKNTRLAMAQALKSLLHTHSLERITVRDIVERCGVGRQTFYYYFQDKYDLMDWIYDQEASPFFEGEDAGSWSRNMTAFCRHMWQNKSFFSGALQTTGARSFPAFLRALIVDEAIRSVRDISGNRPVDLARFRYVAEFCSIALVGMLVDWADHGMKEDPVVFVEKMRNILDGSAVSEMYGSKSNERI